MVRNNDNFVNNNNNSNPNDNNGAIPTSTDFGIEFSISETFNQTSIVKNPQYEAGNKASSRLSTPSTKWTCFLHTNQNTSSSGGSTMFIGRSDGAIIYFDLYRLAMFGGKAPVRPSLSLTPSSSKNHKGSVTCLCWQDGYLFSGSSDRTIKVWNAGIYRGEDPCVQTLWGHGREITALECMTSNTNKIGEGGLMSTSLDHTLKIWTPESSRSLLLNSFYVCTHTFTMEANDGGLSKDIGWFTCLARREGEDWTLFAGDSEGSVSVFSRAKPDYNRNDNNIDDINNHNSSIFLNKKWNNLHTLQITSITLVQEQNFLITLSYDTTCLVLDSQTGACFMTIENQNRVRYEGCCWDRSGEQLLICDVKGSVEGFNVYTERKVGGENVGKSTNPADKTNNGRFGAKNNHHKRTNLRNSDTESNNHEMSHAEDEVICKQMAWSNEDDKFLLMFPSKQSIETWTVKRNFECGRFPGHEQSVVGIVCVSQIEERENQMTMYGGRIVDEKDGDEGVGSAFLEEEMTIFTAGLDNQIYCWDEFDKSLRFGFSEKETEISCLGFLARFNLLISGGDDGSVKFWNPDSGFYVTELIHTNTVTAIETAITNRCDFVITSSFDGCICVFDARKRKESAASMLEYKFDTSDKVEEKRASEEKNCEERSDNLRTSAASFEKLREMASEDSEVLCLHYHEETGLLVSGGNDLYLRSFNLEIYALDCKWNSCHSDSITSLTGDASYLFSGSGDGTIAVWNLGTTESISQPKRRMRRLGTINAHKNAAVTATIFITTTGYLVSAGTDNRICVWDYTSGSDMYGDGYLLKVLSYHDAAPKCLTFRESFDSSIINVFVGTRGGDVLSFRLKDDLMNQMYDGNVGIENRPSMMTGLSDGDRRSVGGRRGSGIQVDMAESQDLDTTKAKERMKRGRKTSLTSLHAASLVSDIEGMNIDVREVIQHKIKSEERGKRESVERARRESVAKQRRGSINVQSVGDSPENRRRGSSTDFGVGSAAAAALAEMRENF